MRVVARSVLTGVLVFCPGVLFAGQAASPTNQAPDGAKAAEVSFQFERPGLSVPRFHLLLREDGTGIYQAEQVERSSTNTLIRGEEAQHIDRAILVSPATVTKIFKAARGLNYFNIACGSKAKNIADTGKKILNYSGTDGHGLCIYNYSENKDVDMVGQTFIRIAYTLDEGRRLEFLHRYDRLGLDAETAALEEEVEAGRALELGTISQTLTAIANDTAVMQRVRLRAAKMLELSK